MWIDNWDGNWACDMYWKLLDHEWKLLFQAKVLFTALASIKCNEHRIRSVMLLS